MKKWIKCKLVLMQVKPEEAILHVVKDIDESMIDSESADQIEQYLGLGLVIDEDIIPSISNPYSEYVPNPHYKLIAVTNSASLPGLSESAIKKYLSGELKHGDQVAVKCIDCDIEVNKAGYIPIYRVPKKLAVNSIPFDRIGELLQYIEKQALWDKCGTAYYSVKRFHEEYKNLL